MRARQRNVGNGYRSGSIGMGMSGSRFSPERPMRGRGFYGSEHQHRGFNPGYGRGRGRSKSYQNQLPPPPPPPPVQHRSGDDVFMEAGRLAAEYLVSQGVLPQTVLSSKWQNGHFRKQAGEFQSSRSQEAARVDVLAPAADKWRYIDGYSSAGSRNNFKGRRSRHHDSDFGRSGSCSERSKAFEIETGEDSVSGHPDEQPLAEDIASSVQQSASGVYMKKREGEGDSESVLDKYNLQDEAQSKTGSSSAGKEIVHDCEISKVSDGSSSLSAGSGEMKGRTGGNGGGNENQTAIEDASIHQHCAADESFTKSGIDLATLCKFEKVPTRTRSSLTTKGPKLCLSQNIKETSHNSGLVEEDQTKNRCETRGQSSGEADYTGNENFNDQVEDLALVQFVENSKCLSSNSFPNSILRDNSEKDAGLELPNLHRSHSVGKVGEKRGGEGSDLEEEAKRQRDWVPLPVSEPNEGFNIFKTSETQCDPEEEEKTSSFNNRLIDVAAGKMVSHESLVNNSTGNRTHTGKTESGYAEEHQLFPASFKICDLNLGGASDVNDGKRESGQAVDFDLSVSSSSKSLDFSTSTRMSNGKEIEVIDLDDDSLQVVKSSDDPGRKQEEGGPYMGINDYNDGLMMVEFLDSFGNIPQINPDISSAPQNNVVGLQDNEGALGNDQVANNTDDDSIFMSLGEIPLTFLQAWDQPLARVYEKPF